LPEDVQEAFLRTIPGLEAVSVLKPGYAVEYDFVYPDQLTPWLETRLIKNLFLAGQLNGTSGYEEAAGQGIIAGINAGCRAKDLEPFVLTREESFIGTMIDDLVTKNVYEPYRMMTSRSEYRLLLRQDNATFRLSEKAYQLGLLSEESILKIRAEKDDVLSLISYWKKTSTSDVLAQKLGLKHKQPLYQIIKRTEVDYDYLLENGLATDLSKETVQRALVETKYEGYLEKQRLDVEKIQNYESKKIPLTIDFDAILGLKKESREKFISFKPSSIYEAKKIAGINPADIMVLLAYLERQR
jgi:tRNA uridine 5-carboxymethylaminomethyl modification enzyme